MAALFKTEVARRFQRAIRLDTDFGSPAALSEYVPLAASLATLKRIGDQVAQSSQRAFTWTGPYGGGKSSLALILASLLDGDSAVRRAAMSAVGARASAEIQRSFGLSKNGWLIVPVVGQRSNIVSVLDNALTQALRRRFKGRLPKAISEASRDGAALLKRIASVAAVCGDNGDGVLIIVDEMGRSLEFASADGDLAFLQDLAETIGRLEHKVVLVGVLHQAFEQYASKLGSDGRDEWAKIQGRFVDIPLTTGPEETVRLISEALVGDNAPKGHGVVCGKVTSLLKERRVGLPTDFAEVLKACWPLHPLVALLLASVARRRFGQNERSTFGFLNSGEPGGFQDFLAHASSRHELYGLPEFWNYLRLNLEPAILASSDGHRWAQAVEAVDRAESKGGADHIAMAKSIAMLDLFGGTVGLSADEKLVRDGLLNTDKTQTIELLDDLRSWSIVVFRAHNKSWAIFAGSDFDIDAELAAAKARVEVDYDVLQQILTQQVVIAKRHYYERGTMRWFDVRIAPLNNVKSLVDAYQPTRGACGLFILVIPESREAVEVMKLQAELASEHSSSLPFFVGFSRSAQEVRTLILELSALEYVRKNASILEGDQVARREIAARSSGMREQLDQKMNEMLSTASWYRSGKSQAIKSIADLSKAASQCADEFFCAAPAIKNELINRTKPSSNAVSAANELMRLMVLHGDKKSLGIEGFPPQRAIYESVLAAPGIHKRDRQTVDTYKFDTPSSSELGKTYAQMWSEGEKFLASTEQARAPLSRLYTIWSKAPYGIRAGIIPIYALALLLAREEYLALYLDGQFVPAMDAFFVDRMLQSPDAVEVRRFQITGVARSTLERLSTLLTDRAEGSLSIDALSVAKPLVAFGKSLHNWVKRTRTLSPTTIACRDCILRAVDPVALLFEELPEACGIEPIVYNAKNVATLNVYTDTLRRAIDELRSAYPRLLDKISAHVGNQLDGSLTNEESRFDLSRRAAAVVGISGDFRVDAFATRLKSASDAVEWVESVGGLAANKPVRDWIDNDIDRAIFELSDLAARFKRVEVVAKTFVRQSDSENIALVIGHGSETRALMESVEISSEDKAIARHMLNDLKAQLTSKGIPQGHLLAVIAEIAKEVIETQRSSGKAEDLPEASSKRANTWRN